MLLITFWWEIDPPAAESCRQAMQQTPNPGPGNENRGPISRSSVARFESVVQTIHESDCWKSSPWKSESHRNVIDQELVRLLCAAVAGGSSSSTTWVSHAWVTACLNWSAHNSWYAASHRERYLTWNALGSCNGASFANLSAGCIRNLASADLLFHAAGGVWDLLCAGLCHHLAGCVWNASSNALFAP